MTAPIWLASPPELHSALLSSGPGPGPLEASAAEWTALSVTYTEAADELSALLADVTAGAWAGPTAAGYVAAHAPYLAWLTQAGADSAAKAAQQHATAVAYTSALAAMPTLVELAANHATHAVLTVTNFFGINTIPIALNEADYARMWIQAATVMGTYEALSTAAVTATPQTGPAPEILRAEAQRAATAAESSTPFEQFQQWLWQTYTTFYNDVIQPFIDAIANLPYFQAMFGGFDPYLVILGNPLTYFSPLNIAFALGYPMDLATYVALLSQMFSFVALDLTAAFASGNPATIGFTILFVTVEIIGTVVTDTIALLKTTLESTLVLTLAVVPLLTAPLVPLAAGAVLAPLGVKGLLALAAAAPPPLPGATPPPPVAALVPSVPSSTPGPTPTAVEAVTPSPAPAPVTPPTAAPPSVTGSGIGLGMPDYGYLVGGLSLAAKRGSASAARRKASEPDDAAVAAPAPAPEEPTGAPKRRRTRASVVGRGREYADLDPTENVAVDDRLALVSASGRNAGTLGFAGVAPERGARPVGLIADDDPAPRVPMLPNTWEPDDQSEVNHR